MSTTLFETSNILKTFSSEKQCLFEKVNKKFYDLSNAVSYFHLKKKAIGKSDKKVFCSI